MPVQHILTVLPEPLPVHPAPDTIDAVPQRCFIRIGRAVEILPGAKQTLQQVRSFDEIRPIEALQILAELQKDLGR